MVFAFILCLFCLFRYEWRYSWYANVVRLGQRRVITVDLDTYVMLLRHIVILTPVKTPLKWVDLAHNRVEKFPQYIKWFCHFVQYWSPVVDQVLQYDEHTHWSMLLLWVREKEIIASWCKGCASHQEVHSCLSSKSFNTRLGSAFFKSENLADLSETIYMHSIHEVIHLVHQ